MQTRWTDRVVRSSADSQRSRFIQVDRPKHKDFVAFDIERSLRFAELCLIPYHLKEEKNVWSRLLRQKTPEQRARSQKSEEEIMANLKGYNLIEEFATQDMHAAIMANDDGIVVAFRGTFRNLNELPRGLVAYEQTEHPFGGKVNKACMDTMQSSISNGTKTLQAAIEDSLVSFLDAVAPDKPPPKLYFSGHSIGGCMACISAAEWIKKHEDLAQVDSIYTYGQPRVGNPEFSSKLEQKTKIWRIVLPHDPIPLRPGKYGPSENKKKSSDQEAIYKHCGQPIIIDPETLSITAKSSTKHLQKMEQNLHFFKNPSLYWGLKDHHPLIEAYINGISLIKSIGVDLAEEGKSP